ncbi:choice-of-anchor K domain-containing protein [Aliarcobacter cryaerophilus]|uniref:Calx-beta domain-containing protein n=1 Tax=Aliarcobacter cryaerophilus TaxID=28198 RepID=A0A2S9TLR1_9BACT|nr:choice-of-anchor K domain-containing protein [Aliarcobacter cryaerophilus]PRM99764.1 hypothetical protein CJ668_09780 [Arcobacter cryaerophilus gv. pseudocryaerophilus]
MANLAQIQSIAQGQFFVKDSLGNLTELKVGDTVSLNDTIVAASSNTDLSKIEILFDTNELITLSQGEQLLDTTLLASTFGNEELAFDKQEVDDTLNAWNNTEASDATDMETAAGDVTEQATNAGDERAADGGALRSKFNSRDGSSTDVRSDLRDGDFDGGNPETPQEQIPTELLNPVGTTATPDDQTAIVSITGPSDVVEGDVTTPYTVSISQAPVTDLTVTFTYTGVAVDGTDFTGVASVVIPAGQTSTTFTIATLDDNLAEGAEKFTVAINPSSLGAVGGLEDVRVSTVNNSVETTITDETVPATPDDQTAIVSITGPSDVVEGDVTTPYTVSISQAPVTDLTVTFTYTGVAVDGTDFTGVASVVIPAGQTSTTFTIATLDDNLAEGAEKFTVAINPSSLGAVGGLEDVRVSTVNNSVETTITDDDIIPITVTVSEEGLTNGIIDNNGVPSDVTNETSVQGYVNVSNLTLSSNKEFLLNIPTTNLNSNGDEIIWELNSDKKELVGKVSGENAIKITIDNNGKYEVELLKPIDHPSNSEEDILSFDVSITLKDGAFETQTKLTVNIEDDMPTISDTDSVVWATKQEIPEIFAGEVSFKGNRSSSSKNKFTFGEGAVEVTAKGFKGIDDLTLEQAKVNQSQAGLGVASKNAPYHNLENEVDYRIGQDGKGASEELTIKLTDGKVSYGATISFEKMYGGELEVGVAEFYRDGKLVSTQVFNSDATSGNYAANFEVKDGGFDTIVLKALDNGKPARNEDNSDFTVSGVNFFGTSDAQPISYAEGTIDYAYGADGKGSIGFTGVVDEITTASGKAVNITHTNNEIIARDSDGELVYQVQFTPATGKWEFFQYQKFEIIGGVSEALDIKFALTDSDGDKVETSIQIGVNKLPVVSTESIVVYEEDMASGSQAKGEKNFADGVINLKSGADISTIAIGNTSISISDLKVGNFPESIKVTNGKLTITGYENGKISYKYELTEAHKHDQSKGEGEYAEKDINIKVTESNGELTTTTIKVGIHDDTPMTSSDDSQAGGNVLVVPVKQVDVGNIQAGFTSYTGGNNNTKYANSDDIPGNDTLTWGDKSNRSGYEFKANEEFKFLSEDLVNTRLELGTFTHMNDPIPSGSGINGATLTVEFDVVIDGQVVHVKHDIQLKHTETPNTKGKPLENRDEVEILSSSATKEIQVGGKTYELVIDGFLYENGEIVKKVYTWEADDRPNNNSNSFKLYASIKSKDTLPYITGNAFGDDAGENAIFGADGKASSNAIVWENGVVADGVTTINHEFGTLKVENNGDYTFTLNRETYDNLKEDKEVTFKYTATDADGDSVDSQVTINLQAAITEVESVGQTINGTTNADVLFGTSGDDTINGGKGDDKIYAGAGDDKITGGEGKDVIYGGAGDDKITTDLHTIPQSGSWNNSTPAKIEGDLLIDGGTGFDTLILEGNNNIDFSILNVADRIHNIEAIDLTNGKHDLKNLKLDDVLKMTDSNKELIIFGDQFDSVTFKKNDGWELKTENMGKVEGDKAFDVYTNSRDSTVQVKVEQPISDGITN